MDRPAVTENMDGTQGLHVRPSLVDPCLYLISMSPATRTPAFLDQQRRMARGIRLMLDDSDERAIALNPRSFGGQAGNETKQVPRYLLGDAEPT